MRVTVTGSWLLPTCLTLLLLIGLMPHADTQTSCPAFSRLYAFGGAPDGELPLAGLTLASDGLLYGTTIHGGASNLGTTSSGGVNGYGTIFAFDPSVPYNPYAVPIPTGGESIVHSFGAIADGTHPLSALTQAKDGKLYGTTGGGISASGQSFYGTIFSYDPGAGAYASLYDFPILFGPVFGGSTPQGTMIQASDGVLYGAAPGGGYSTFTNGAAAGGIFSFNPVTGAGSVVYSFQGAPDGANPQGPLIEMRDGSLYGTSAGFVAGDLSSPGTIFRIKPSLMPVVVSIRPNSVVAGSPAFTLTATVNGVTLTQALTVNLP